jgi:hypothetical protein
MATTIELQVEKPLAAENAVGAVVASTSPGLTLSGLSWATPAQQAVRSVGAVDAGEAGELAVRAFGPALEELADN